MMLGQPQSCISQTKEPYVYWALNKTTALAAKHTNRSAIATPWYSRNVYKCYFENPALFQLQLQATSAL